ncbi:hypothetical protein DW974_12855 [Lachnospiraceae bacterium AM48-27BH]|nr:hypothetical protein DW974_12855 [Lachnospiraceae bacterium AM48-27BH]
MEISLNTRAETAKLFLDTIRPLKSCYSPGHAFLHVGDSGVHYGEKAARMEASPESFGDLDLCGQVEQKILLRR